MKIAVIGANGNVGTELCYLLKDDCDLIPIVRNRIGSVFLEHNDMRCRIADISKPNDAKKVLSDVDIVVNSAWVADRFSGSQNQSSRLINKEIIENSVKFSKKDATIIYLSTIRAFAHKVDPTTSKFWPPRYDVEKQYLEKILISQIAKNKKKGIVFRCGHVFGDGQPNTRLIKKILETNNELTISVSPNTLSNVLHIVTLKDAILKCVNKEIKSGIYSLVNNPQWTWKEIFNFYNNSCKLKFTKYKQKYFSLSESLYKILKINKKYLIPILYRAPKKIEPRIIKELSMRKFRSEISKLNLEEFFTIGNFAYKQIPGPFLNGLEDTKKLLQDYESKIFQLKN
ncbi:MAG: sugar nucleotide-binding protein [Thaumarchaeota archaeon]|nr:sugar nucleotide-binding protein [Nitrososphaerota archaeon]